MDENQSIVQSFIVRVWGEERAEEEDRGIWRSHITHVPGGERRYLKNLDEIGDFIAPYLESMGVRFEMSWHMRRLFRYLMGRG